MNNGFAVLLFSVCMLVGCYLAGILPLVVSFSEARLKYISVVGAGLLVGTALAVIIPEGMNAILTVHNSETAQHGVSNVQTVSSAVTETAHGEQLHSAAGTALVLGFVVMLLVDFVTQRRHRHTTCAANVSATNDDTAALDSECGGVSAGSVSLTATIGLVVHAAADGIALGAAVASSRADVELIVFIAIMLHKAPAAFGLVTYLLHAGVDRVRVRRHLLVFSFSAPLTAVLTYMFISMSGGGGEALAQSSATGLCLLFSGGTFLYVSTVHVLPDVLDGGGHSGGVSKQFQKRHLLLLIFGCLLPLLLSFNHHH